MFEIDLRNHLLSHQSLTNHISTRLYPGWIPENAPMPSVAFLEVSGVRHHDINVAYPRFQFSVFSPNYIQAKNIANEIRNALQRFKGNMGTTRVIQGVWEGGREMYENDTKLYHISTDFKLIYRDE